MADGTATLRNQLYDAAVRTDPVYLALYSDATTEIVATGYARQLISMGESVDGVGANDAEVDFGAWTGAGGPITHAALFDAASGGNRLTVIKALAVASSWIDDFPVVVAIGDLGFSVQ